MWSLPRYRTIELASPWSRIHASLGVCCLAVASFVICKPTEAAHAAVTLIYIDIYIYPTALTKGAMVAIPAAQLAP